MNTERPKTSSGLAQGIKSVGVGKRGSKTLSKGLIEHILDELLKNQGSKMARGAFFGALLIKGVTKDEALLEEALTPGALSSPQQLIELLAPESSDFIKKVCIALLKKQTLDQITARKVGDFLFSDLPGDGARGLIASVLRVRYEAPSEYQGLLLSLQDTLESSFKTSVPQGETIIQMAEPFDGVDHSNLITPLIADYFQKQSYRVVCLVGRNSGPKLGNNLLDLAKTLNVRFLTDNRELKGEKPIWGWYIKQEDMSKPMNRWVELRRQIIKRPFLATLERFINPAKADIMIASAFHPPYGEKMLTICEQAGFPGAVIVRNGMEGTIAFPLKRAAKILCSAKQKSGSYARHELIIHPEEYVHEPIEVEEKLDSPSLDKNAALIREYKDHGSTDYQLFDFRVKVTCIGLKKAVEWIENQINK